jgi:hypothetical protein
VLLEEGSKNMIAFSSAIFTSVDCISCFIQEEK